MVNAYALTCMNSRVALMSMPEGRHCCYPHIIDEETEAQRGSITCPSPTAAAVLFIWLHQVFVATCEIQFPNQDQTRAPALGAWSSGSWTTREAPETSC